MKNTGLQIATDHLQLAQKELNECATKLSSYLETLMHDQPSDQLLEVMAALQLQDIITQRLQKVQSFLQLLDEHVDLKASQEYLREFAWENEVDQDDIDAMFNEYKG